MTPQGQWVPRGVVKAPWLGELRGAGDTGHARLPLKSPLLCLVRRPAGKILHSRGLHVGSSAENDVPCPQSCCHGLASTQLLGPSARPIRLSGLAARVPIDNGIVLDCLLAKPSHIGVIARTPRWVHSNSSGKVEAGGISSLGRRSSAAHLPNLGSWLRSTPEG